MADLDLEELERLAAAADFGFVRIVALSDRTIVMGEHQTYADCESDAAAEYIAASYAAVPALIAEARRVPALEEEVRRLRAEVERRPEISPEDASYAWTVRSVLDASDDDNALDACQRVEDALRAHAQKAVKS